MLPFYKIAFKKKNEDKDQINRVSFVSEIRFGYYLHNKFVNLQYDPKIFGKTPDWVVSTGIENIIFEVKQFNPSNEIFAKRIEQVIANQYSVSFGKNNKTYTYEDIFPYLVKIMAKEKNYRDFIEDKNFKIVICVNFTNLETEFFTDDDLVDYLDLKRNYEYFKQTIDYLDVHEFEKFCKNVAGFLVMPIFGADIFFIENKMCQSPLSKETINKLEMTYL